jgi:nitrogen fixation protein NifZ
MQEQRRAKYQWGQRVSLLAAVYNDGTFPGRGEEELLAEVGRIGEIVQVGHHTEADLPIYLVAFNDDLVIGCFEEELQPL